MFNVIKILNKLHKEQPINKFKNYNHKNINWVKTKHDIDFKDRVLNLELFQMSLNY